MNATSIIAKIVEQQKKLRELAEANGIAEAIVNMGATADPTELYKIMYPEDEEEDDEEIWECYECGKEMIEKEISRQLVSGGCLCKECDKFPEDKEVINCEDCCCYATEYVVKCAVFTRYNERRYYHCLECEKTK